MFRKIALTAAIFLFWSPSMSSAQESKRYAPQPEHELLKRFEGEWTFERFSEGADGSTPEKLGTGEISAGLLGELFVVSRWSGNLYGYDFSAVQTLGYDIDKEAYAGSWVDGFMNYQWQLEGSLDPDGKEFILASEGPAPDGGTTRFRERYRFESADAITVLAEMRQDGEWTSISNTRLARKQSTPRPARDASE